MKTKLQVIEEEARGFSKAIKNKDVDTATDCINYVYFMISHWSPETRREGWSLFSKWVSETLNKE
jgi:hypothetical protein